MGGRQWLKKPCCVGDRKKYLLCEYSPYEDPLEIQTMTMNVLGYAATSAKAPLAPYRFVRRKARADDVVIHILYCGVCHSDLHQVRDDWGGATCKQGQEQYCEEGATWTYNDKDRHDDMPTFGGYSETIVAPEKFVLRIPDGLDLKGAAPLLCAGITTWSPLRHWGVGKGTNVGVVGLGGIGHMDLKLTKALGANVTLFTRSPGKEQDARRLGADSVVISTDAGQMAAVNGKYDLIIDTVPYAHDLNPYLPVLSLDGTLVLVGLLGDLEPALNTVPLILGRKSVAGSVIGGIAETQELLDFCGEQGITADVEVIKIQDINQAYERMLRSDVRYRFVIDLASLNL